MNKITTIKKLFYTPNCYGFAIATNDKKGKYIWQNTNDLGLASEINEATEKQTILRKIKIKKGAYIYVLRNTYGLSSERELIATEKQLITLVKHCYKKEFTLTEEEEKFINKYYNG